MEASTTWWRPVEARRALVVVGLLACASGQLVLPQVAAEAGAASSSLQAAVASSPSSAALAQLQPLQAWVLSALSRRKDDYDDYDYGDDDEDDDYDYYGTKQKKKKKKPTQAAAVTPSETNVFNFVRIMVLRIVWGFASLFGFEEPLSEAFNGAFVPPGVDYDDGGLGFDY